MFQAASNGNIEEIKKLLEEGADVNQKVEGNWTALMTAARYSNTTSSYDTVKLLLDAGADVNLKDKDGRTALMWAAHFSNTTSSLETVKLLLDSGANVNLKNNDGYTALILASELSNTTSSLETIKLLLDSGANINLKDNKRWTPLMFAARYSNSTSSADTVKLLLENGADINTVTNIGSSALMFAARYSNASLETVKLLLDRGANINLQDDEGYSALSIASHFSNATSSLETMRLLIERGADVFITSVGKTIPEICPTQECKDLINKAIWDKLYLRDLNTAKRYASSTSLPKDIWEIILLNKRQQELCKNLQSNKNLEILKFFALSLEIPIPPNITKGQLCGLISRYLAYERYHSEKRESLVKQKTKEDILKIKEVASRFGVDVRRPINEILKDLASLM